MRMRFAVRRNEAVDVEVPVVGLVSKVTTVCPTLYTIIFLDKPLVHPVPDDGTSDAGVGIDDIPVLLKVAH